MKPSPAPVLDLAPGAVLLVPVPLDRGADDEDAALALLDDEERARARRFRLAEVARRFVVSHAALRAVLGELAGAPPRDVRLRPGPAGKPALAVRGRDVDIRFNLSHAGDLAVIALARGREVGVDVELLRPLPERARLARRILAPDEAAAFAALPPAAQEPALMRCWTRKEALLKAVGCGLRVPLNGVSVGFDPLAAAGSVVPDPLGSSARWRLLPIQTPAGWVGALAVEEREGPPPRLLAGDCPPLSRVAR